MRKLLIVIAVLALLRPAPGLAVEQPLEIDPGDRFGATPDAPRAGVFLVASDEMSDPRFRETVILLLEHDATGSLGLIVNRRTDVELGALVPDLAQLDRRQRPVYLGGPLAGSGLMFLTTDRVSGAHGVPVIDGVRLGSEAGVLEQLLDRGAGDGQARVYVGYCGWAAGQLDLELLHGGWELAAAAAEDVFSAHPDTLWHRIVERQSPRGLIVRGPWLNRVWPGDRGLSLQPRRLSRPGPRRLTFARRSPRVSDP